ncbi:MAG TPA: hypothetical protein HA319_04560 [Nitrosopumilaceae archaeon]|nr:hypothetical protein [Nitrosopumilaceae archaeon]
MVTQEQIIQRRVKFAKQFVEQGASVPQAVKLSGVAEATAQRRGRAYDPLAVVIETAVAPPPPPVPTCKPDEMLSGNKCVPRTVPGLGCFQVGRKQSIARGIALSGCPGMPGFVYISDYTDQRNYTTEKYYNQTINENQKALKAAGYKLPASQVTLSQLAYDIGKASQAAIKQCGKTAYYQNSSSCKSARANVEKLRKKEKDLMNAPYGWF